MRVRMNLLQIHEHMNYNKIKSRGRGMHYKGNSRIQNKNSKSNNS